MSNTALVGFVLLSSLQLPSETIRVSEHSRARPSLCSKLGPRAPAGARLPVPARDRELVVRRLDHQRVRSSPDEEARAAGPASAVVSEKRVAAAEPPLRLGRRNVRGVEG